MTEVINQNIPSEAGETQELNKFQKALQAFCGWFGYGIYGRNSSKKRKKIFFDIITYIILLAGAFTMVYPLWWMFAASFATNDMVLLETVWWPSSTVSEVFSAFYNYSTSFTVLDNMWNVEFSLLRSILNTLIYHFGAYTKRSGDAATTAAGTVLVYPSVAQSITEVQDLSLMALLSYFHPWMEAALLGLVGFVWVLIRRPGALFLLPLAALGLLSTKMGGRMVMFGAPIVAVGLTLPLYWILQRVLRDSLRGAVAGLVTSAVLIGLLVAPFASIIQAMSQGPMINRRHADALTRARDVTPKDGTLWLWWDWGYAAHHFARRATIADGALHNGPWLYLPAAVFATNNARFARQLIRYTALKGGEADDVFRGLDGEAAQALMDKLRSPDTPLVEARGKQYLVVSYEMLRPPTFT